MAKIKRRGSSGQAKNFITRTQAVRKLQISLPDFRRLCIFKGIYPREPRNKKKVSKSSTPSTTFYYTKDIQYLLHEPLLRKFRDHKALAKKIAKALGRGEASDAARLERNHAPRITLDHIIKERYPTFVDALRDLDDALSLLFLFASLPSTVAVPAKTIARCQRLCLEFEHYLIATRSLKKSFLSIKGIYYQATIQGQDILWLVPYRFVQRLTGDIDFRIMGTFVEFYTTLLGFVNFRLYTSIGLVYPPKFNASSDERGAELGAFTLEGKEVGNAGDNTQTVKEVVLNTSSAAQAEADKVAALPEPETNGEQTLQVLAVAEPSDEIDRFEAVAEDADSLPQPQAGSTESARIFEPFTIWLSRETPRQPLEFLLKAFGCKRVGWDAVLGDGAFITNEADTSITHQVVDRPSLPVDSGETPNPPEALGGQQVESDGAPPPSAGLRPGARVPGRIYIQPQWVWDCVNAGKLLRPDLYAPGATLPPHLSPWVKPTKGQYDPTAPLAEQEVEGEAEEAQLDDDEPDQAMGVDSESRKMNSGESINGQIQKLIDQAGIEADAAATMDVAGSESEESVHDTNPSHVMEEEEWGGLDNEGGDADAGDSADEAEKLRLQHQRELEAEASGVPFSKAGLNGPSETDRRAEARRKAARKRKDEQEELERQKMMMPRKKRKILEKMLYGNAKRDAEAEKLRAKRRKIERAGA